MIREISKRKSDKKLPIDLSIKFFGGEADEHKLDFYDGSSSLFGFSKSIKIATHFLYTGKVAFQAPSTRGCKLFLLPSYPGSYSQKIQLDLDVGTVKINGIEVPITEELYQDFLRVTFARTLGLDVDPKTDEIYDLVRRRRGDLDALSESLDGPLKEAHSFIGRGRVRTLKSTKLFTSAGEEIVKLDRNTLDYVSQRITSDQTEEILGTVDAYNRNAGTGRLSDPQQERTIPFKIDKKFDVGDKSPITWSLDRKERGLDGTIQIYARRVTTTRGLTKSYLLRGCSLIRNNR